MPSSNNLEHAAVRGDNAPDVPSVKLLLLESNQVNKLGRDLSHQLAVPSYSPGISKQQSGKQVGE